MLFKQRKQVREFKKKYPQYELKHTVESKDRISIYLINQVKHMYLFFIFDRLKGNHIWWKHHKKYGEDKFINTEKWLDWFNK